MMQPTYAGVKRIAMWRDGQWVLYSAFTFADQEDI